MSDAMMVAAAACGVAWVGVWLRRTLPVKRYRRQLEQWKQREHWWMGRG